MQELGQHVFRLGVMLVDLVDRHDDGRLRRLRVLDRFDRLRHHTVVRRHHEDDDVGGVGAAGAHGREGRVARRVEEGDLLAGLELHLIGADVLRDAACLARHDVSLTESIKKRGLAVVDVTHDGHDRRTRLEMFVMVVQTIKADLDVGFRHAFHGVAKFLDDQLRRVGVEHVGRANEFALLHHELHDVSLTLAHAVGEIGNRDRFRQHDFARDFLARAAGHFQATVTLAFTGAFHGCVGTLLFLIVAKGGRDGQPALTAFGFIFARRTDFAAAGGIVAAGLHAFDATAELAQRRQIIRIERDKRTGSASGATARRAAGTTRTIAAETTRTRSAARSARRTRSTRTTRASIRTHANSATGTARSRSAVAAETTSARTGRSATRLARCATIGTHTTIKAAALAGIFFRLGRAGSACFEAALFFFGKALGFFGPALVGFVDRFLFSAAAFLVSAAQRDGGLARLEFSFREAGLLDCFLSGRQLLRRSLDDLLGLGTDNLGVCARCDHHALFLRLHHDVLGTPVGEALLHSASVRALQRKRAATCVVRVLRIRHSLTSVAVVRQVPFGLSPRDRRVSLPGPWTGSDRILVPRARLGTGSRLPSRQPDAPEPGKPSKLPHPGVRYWAKFDASVYHTVASQGHAQFDARKTASNRGKPANIVSFCRLPSPILGVQFQIGTVDRFRKAKHLVPLIFGGVRRSNETAGPGIADRLAHLLEAEHQVPCPPRHSQHVETTARQQRLDLPRHVGRNRDLTLERTRKGAACRGQFDRLAACRHPAAPAGQARCDIGRHHTIGRHNKADHLERRTPLHRRDAAALWRFLGRSERASLAGAGRTRVGFRGVDAA